ncbi:ABC transporter ATP-binding protein [Spirochaeta dissipatitropha]
MQTESINTSASPDIGADTSTITSPGIGASTSACQNSPGTSNGRSHGALVSQALLELQGLGLCWAGHRQSLFENINLQVYPGQQILLSGDNGCGKSTLLAVIKGLLRSEENSPHEAVCHLTGRILYKGQDTGSRTAAERSEIGLVFQDPDSQFCTLNADDELYFSLEQLGMARPEMELRYNECVQRWRLQNLVSRRIDQLSGGQKQLLALAAIMIQQPRLLLLDEITSQLDPWEREYLWHGLQTMLSNQPETAMICVDHAYSGPHNDQLMHLRLDTAGLIPSVPVQAAPTAPGYATSATSAQQTRPTAQRHLQEIQSQLPAHTGKEITRPLVSARNISYRYRSAAAPLWSGVNIQLPAGKILAIVGPNGSGKSTLLAVLAGLLKPGEGNISLPRRRLLIPQNPEHLFLYNRVWRELGSDLESAMPVLQHFGLARSRQYSPYRLSHGQKRRLNLGLAHISTPELLLLDEPTQGQDPAFRTRILQDITGHARRGAAVIVATHDWDLVQTIADEVLLCG